MKSAKIIEFPRSRKKNDLETGRDRHSAGIKGRVYSRGGKLWVDFRYLGERVREPSGMENTSSNRDSVRKQLDLIVAEIENGLFSFAERFPSSKRKDHFTFLEGKAVRKDPSEVLFGEYVKRWWEEMQPGMSENQIRDYSTSLKNHLLPFFGSIPFSEFRPVVVKKFIAHLKGKKNRYGQPLSPKTVHNYLIPLRVIVRDAFQEFEWYDLRDPFWGLKLPKQRRIRIQPFNYREWFALLENVLPWYRPYFDLAVQTGLRPSEQVALRWSAIDEKFIHIESSIVRKVEKADLKTPGSFRRIELRPNTIETLKRQWELSEGFGQDYVFVNSEGRPIQQENLGKIWRRALSKAGLRYRRMYETRHTFASWALAAGEAPEWVARTLGRVDTSMVYRTYGRYIPNLTRRDGSAFEKRYGEAEKKEGNPNLGHNLGHNHQNPDCHDNLSYRNNYDFLWSGRLDLNQRLPRPERGALPD
jgi:integrase